MGLIEPVQMGGVVRFFREAQDGSLMITPLFPLFSIMLRETLFPVNSRSIRDVIDFGKCGAHLTITMPI